MIKRWRWFDLDRTFRASRVVGVVGVCVALSILAPPVPTNVGAEPAMPGGECRVAPRRGWSPTERWAWRRICVGRVADLDVLRGSKANPSDSTQWDQRRKLSAKFLETIVLHEPYRSAQGRKGVRIRGAWFPEEIDLSGGELPHELWIDGSRLENGANMSRITTPLLISFDGSTAVKKVTLEAATLGGLFMNHGYFRDVDLTAARIRATANFASSVIEGTLDLDGVELDSSLVVASARVNNVAAAGSRIGGSLLARAATILALEVHSTRFGRDLDLSRGWLGKVLLTRTSVGGLLGLSRAKVAGNVTIDATEIGSTLFVDQGVKVVGGIKVVLSSIGGDLAMEDCGFKGPLIMDNVTVRNRVLVRNGCDLRNGMRIVFSSIGGSFDLRGARFRDTVDLTGTQIGGTLRLAGEGLVPHWDNRAALVLRNVKAVALQDGISAWSQRLDIQGLEYARWTRMEGGDEDVIDVSSGADPYIAWLSKNERYSPQPYEQLASVFERMGHSEEASDVRYAGHERARARAYEDGHWLSWLGQSLLRVTMGYGYGYRYFWALGWVVLLVAIGKLVLAASKQTSWTGRGGAVVNLGWVYALDMLLPVMRLREAHYEVDLQGWARYYFYLHRVLGLIIGSFLLAGLTGLTQK